MRMRLLAVGFLASMMFLGGCVGLKTTEPLYTEKDRASEPALEGKWTPMVDNEGWKVNGIGAIKEQKGLYILNAGGQDVGAKEWRMILFKLGPHFMAELVEMPVDLEKVKEGRRFAKIAMIEGRIFMAGGFGDTLRRVLEGKPDLIKHEIVKIPNEHDCIVITDTTEKARAFLLEHLTQACELLQETNRRPAGEKVMAGEVMQTKEQESFEVVWMMYSHARLLTVSRDALSRIIPDNVQGTEEIEWRQRYQVELLPKLNLPAEECDEKVAALYKDMRAGLTELFEEVRKDMYTRGDAGVEWKPGDDARRKELDKLMSERMREVEKDPLAFIAKDVAKEGARREKIEKLGKRLMELVGEMEKKYSIKFAAE